MSAVQLFRQAATSVAFARSAARIRPVAGLAGTSRRWYSTEPEKTVEEQPATPADGAAEKTEGASDSGTSELEKKLEAKDAEVTDLKSRLRYLQADFLNLQRNAAREKEQTKDFAITKFAGDLLETVDTLSLALKSVPSTALPAEGTDSSTLEGVPKHLADLHHGVELTHRVLLQTLFKYHVKPFDPTGESFDPNRHEALYQAPVPDKQPGSVIDCQKVGYMIKDRVLRAAQVGVAKEQS
jgi:molecular chaperone GrpE